MSYNICLIFTIHSQCMLLDCKFRGLIVFQGFLNNWHVPFTLIFYVVSSSITTLMIKCLMKIQWLRKTNRKPLLAAVEKMKEGNRSIFEQKTEIYVPSEACDSFLNSVFLVCRIDAAWVHISSSYSYLKYHSQYMYLIKVLQQCICSMHQV